MRVPPEKVVAELCADPMGRALWERAHFAVLSQVQAERIAELEKAAAPTEPPSQGWEVPPDGSS